MYTVAMAKNDLKEGWLDGFSLVRWNESSAHGEGWTIEVWKYGSKNGISRAISAARGQVRVFKTVDAAIKTAEQIGFAVHELKFEKTREQNTKA